MSTTHHVCISVRGVLRKTNREIERDWKGAITDDGRVLTKGQEIREAFMDELAQGHEVIPFGEPCEGFSYKTGCPGHKNGEET